MSFKHTYLSKISSHFPGFVHIEYAEVMLDCHSVHLLKPDQRSRIKYGNSHYMNPAVKINYLCLWVYNNLFLLQAVLLPQGLHYHPLVAVHCWCLHWCFHSYGQHFVVLDQYVEGRCEDSQRQQANQLQLEWRSSDECGHSEIKQHTM